MFGDNIIVFNTFNFIFNTDNIENNPRFHRLEQQHKTELESYREELNKWQTEADTLRQQLSENRVLLTKGNISLMKELQEKDDKIHELSLTCQQLQVRFLFTMFH